MNEFLSEWYGLLLFILFDIVAAVAVIALTYRLCFKRLLDILASSVCLLVTAPAFLTVLIVGKRYQTKKNVSFPFIKKASYIGKKGREIDLLTFRTRGENGELLGGYGCWLARTKLYTLPRLFDVFLGRLSFIGGKPFTYGESFFLSDEEKERFLVRSGLINPLVLSGDENTDYDEMLKSDLSYANGVSLFKDIKILWSWFLRLFREGERNYFGRTKDRGFLDYLYAEGKITKEEFDEAVSAI